LFIKGSNDIYIQFTNNEYAAEFSENGSADLYHNGTRVFSTNSTGITVQGDSNDITFVNSAGSGLDYNYLKVFIPDTTVNVIGVAQEKVGLFANGSEALTIISNGSVGIGTTLPGNLLHVIFDG